MIHTVSVSVRLMFLQLSDENCNESEEVQVFKKILWNEKKMRRWKPEEKKASRECRINNESTKEDPRTTGPNCN